MSHLVPLASGDQTDFLDGSSKWSKPSVVVEAFPVDALFLSFSATNPATSLGYGTWSLTSVGRFLVGVDSGDPDFDTPGETGGAKTVAAAGSVAAPTFTGSALGTHAHDGGTYGVDAHAGTAVDAHAGTAVSAHTGTAVSAHTGTAVAAHASSAVFEDFVVSSRTGATAFTHSVTQPSAHTVTQPSAHTVTQPNNHAVTQPNAHTFSGTSAATSGGTPAGTNSAPAFTGTPTSVLPPYMPCYCLRRTA